MKRKKVFLNDGTIVEGDYFDIDDYNKFIKIYESRVSLNSLTKSLHGRGINIPEIISEGLYCYLFNAIRTNNTPGAKSYDAVDIASGRGIQIKSSSISNDCTSFGPDSTWDDLYFLDFAPNGVIDGQVDIYEIKQDLSNIILNNGKKETFKMQQREGRRPRLSIKNSIIKPNSLKPIKTIHLL